jgi:hypothetical protein
VATYVRTQSIEHDIGQAGRLSLMITSGDVSVRAAQGDQARITANFEIQAASESEANQAFTDAQLLVERGDGELIVAEPERNASLGALVGRLFTGRGQIDLSVTVELPERAEVRLDVVSADANVDGLLGEQRYNTVSGDLSLTALGGSIRVKSVSGDVTMRANQPIAVRADTVSGDLSVVAPMLNGLRANAVSGDVEVEGALSADHEYRIDTVSGDVSVGLLGGATFEVRGLSSDVVSDLDHRIEGRQDRRRVVVGDGGPVFIFNSMSGDLVIRRPRRLDRTAPVPPAPPAPPAPAVSPPAPEDQLAILQALERGEIDVDEASRRLGGHDRE